MNHLLPFHAMLYLRVELHRINLSLPIFHSRNRTMLGMGSNLKTLRHLGNIVGVGHENGGLLRNIGEKHGGLLHMGFRLSIFTDRGGSHLSPKLIGNELCSITETENGDAQLENFLSDMLTFLFVHGLRSPGEDDSLGT